MSDDVPHKIEDNVRSKSTWLRFLYMLILAACFAVAQGVAIAVVLFQFFHVLLTSERNYNLLRFGSSLSDYLFQIARYVTYNADARPFPFDAWPQAEDAENSE